MVFHRSLSNSKSLQVSRTLLSILANFNNTVSLLLLLLLFNFQPYFWFFTILHRVREDSDYMHSMYLFFAASFGCYFFNYIDSILLRRWAVLQSAIILLLCYSMFFSPVLADGLSLEFDWFGLVWFVGFYGISTFVGYLTPNLFLCKQSVLFQTIQFSISTQFNCQKYFYFKIFKQLYVTIQLSVNTVLMSKNSSNC